MLYSGELAVRPENMKYSVKLAARPEICKAKSTLYILQKNYKHLSGSIS